MELLRNNISLVVCGTCFKEKLQEIIGIYVQGCIEYGNVSHEIVSYPIQPCTFHINFLQLSLILLLAQ